MASTFKLKKYAGKMSLIRSKESRRETLVNSETTSNLTKLSSYAIVTPSIFSTKWGLRSFVKPTNIDVAE